MQKPSLSVLTPNYNHEKYISRAIEAIASQSRLPEEYIIIDDASTDNSRAIIQSYAQRYPFIRFKKNESNLGVIETLIRLLSLATGEYVYFAASDDYVLPGFFEKAMNMAVRYPEAGIIFGGMTAIDSEGRELIKLELSRWQKELFITPDVFIRDYADVYPANYSLSAATIYKRKAMLEVGFKKELGPWTDTFALRVVALKYGACYLAYQCCAWTILPESFSNFSLRDPQFMMDIIARAAWLMRSPEFKNYFPEKHVNRWEKEYRNIIIDEHLIRVRESFETQLKICQQGVTGKSLISLLCHILLKFSSLQQRIWIKFLGYILRHYKSEFSCYAKSDKL